MVDCWLHPLPLNRLSIYGDISTCIKVLINEQIGLQDGRK